MHLGSRRSCPRTFLNIRCKTSVSNCKYILLTVIPFLMCKTCGTAWAGTNGSQGWTRARHIIRASWRRVADQLHNYTPCWFRRLFRVPSGESDEVGPRVDRTSSHRHAPILCFGTTVKDAPQTQPHIHAFQHATGHALPQVPCRFDRWKISAKFGWQFGPQQIIWGLSNMREVISCYHMVWSWAVSG